MTPKTTTQKMIRFELLCICGARWHGEVPEHMMSKIKRTFYQEHRRKPGHAEALVKSRHPCKRCGTPMLGKTVLIKGTNLPRKGKLQFRRPRS